MLALEMESTLLEKVTMDTPPETLYKYLDADGAVATLRDLTLKFSSPLELNDPFECLYGDVADGSKEKIINGLIHARENNSEELWRRTCYQLLRITNPEFLKQIRSELDDMQLFSSRIDDFLATFKEAHHRLHYETLGRLAISCFAKDPDNILMWGHYADKHKGCAIGFKTDFYPKWHKVRYCSERIPMPMSSVDVHHTSMDSMRTKSTMWEYEQEWRLICPVKGNGLDERYNERKKQKYYVMGIEEHLQSLTKIILGIRVDERVKEAAMAFVQNNPTCKLSQATIHSSDYRIVIRPFGETAG